MRASTSEAFARLVTAFVPAIEAAEVELPADFERLLSDSPLKACEQLNELALAAGAVDDGLDARCAAIYESMNAIDARTQPDEASRATILRAFARARRVRAAEPAAAQAVEAPAAGAGTASAAGASAAPVADEPQPRKRRGRKPRNGAAAPVQAELNLDVPSKGAPVATAAPEAPASAPAAPSQPVGDDVLTVDQTVAILGWSRPKVYKYIESGKIPAYKKGRSWQVSAAAVSELAAK